MPTTTHNPPEGLPPERPEPDSFGSPPGAAHEPRVAQLPALVALGSLAVGALLAVRELAKPR